MRTWLRCQWRRGSRGSTATTWIGSNAYRRCWPLRLDPNRVTLADAAKLALNRSLPIARLGLKLLQDRTPADESDVPLLLKLAGGMRGVTLENGSFPLAARYLGSFRTAVPRWLLELLDSKYTDIRALGWQRLQESPLKDEPSLWHKLLESPYDDIKGPLVAELANRSSGGADVDTVQMLWASVLLNLYGGGRHKPGVVGQGW